uniref:Arrestin-like N-terminal domain-containing protein n=1 Tax=Phaeomonas parva TaxID=124430 RepID=A0A7S1XKB0_9STRA|mmetsp:Transcript_11039/g.33560  ORF Transcript_11039/g.33560 Transcript_11039/m.33560 type:complete len:302 (+) Transcript_11039:55-960(+)
MAEAEPEHSSVRLAVGRFDRIYRPGETVDGTITIQAKGGWNHQGITLTVVGQVELVRPPNSKGFFSSSTIEPEVVTVMNVPCRTPGRVHPGKTEIPFDFELQASNGKKLYDTYHGMCINISYIISVAIERGSFARTLSYQLEFVVETFPKPKTELRPLEFTITPDSIEHGEKTLDIKIPDFRVVGKLHKQVCPINMPFTGEVRIEKSEIPIRSINLQLIRSETVRSGGREETEASEVQDIQIGSGDVAREMVIPLYMIFPRLYTCPSVHTDRFKVDFEVWLVIYFSDGCYVTESFDIDLFR